ncbi:MAG: ketopantoate reductase family protein [Sphaerochaetaceae bacterium]
MRIAIYGAGSMGTVLGAYLAKGGLDVTLITRNEKHVKAMAEQGAKIVGTVNFTQKVKASLPSQMEGLYEVIFLMTKQLDNRNVVKSLLPFLGKEGIVCTLQNGLPEPVVASIVGNDHTLGCTIAWGAEFVESGVSRLTSAPDSLTFSLGSLDGSVPQEKIEMVSHILQMMGPVEIDSNFIGARWAKLLINSAFSGMSTVLGCTFGEAAQNKESRKIIQAIIKECIDVARANAIIIEPVQGKDIVKLLDYHSPLRKKFSFMIIPLAIKKHKDIRASMLQDIEKGKPCEVDSINGSVCSYGDKANVDTPYNDKVVSLIHAMEKGERKPGWDNLRDFDF